MTRLREEPCGELLQPRCEAPGDLAGCGAQVARALLQGHQAVLLMGDDDRAMARVVDAVIGSFPNNALDYLRLSGLPSEGGWRRLLERFGRFREAGAHRSVLVVEHAERLTHGTLAILGDGIQQRPDIQLLLVGSPAMAAALASPALGAMRALIDTSVALAPPAPARSPPIAAARTAIAAPATNAGARWWRAYARTAGAAASGAIALAMFLVPGARIGEPEPDALTPAEHAAPPPAEDGANRLRADFERYLDAGGNVTERLDGAQRDALFRNYLAWRDNPRSVSVACQCDAPTPVKPAVAPARRVPDRRTPR